MTPKKRVVDNYSKNSNRWVIKKNLKGKIIDLMKQYFDPSFDVLEVGPGVGRFTLHAADYCKTLYAMDISEGMITNCKKNLKDKKNLLYMVGDGTAMPFSDETLDVVTSHRVITKGMCDIEFVLSEAHRVLKPEGYVMILTLSDKDKEELGMKPIGYSEDEMEEVLDNLGFEDIQMFTEEGKTKFKTKKEMYTFFDMTGLKIRCKESGDWDNVKAYVEAGNLEFKLSNTIAIAKK